MLRPRVAVGSVALAQLKGPLGLYVALAAFSLGGSVLCRATGLDPSPVARPAAVVTLALGCFAAFDGLLRSDRKRAALALGIVFGVGLLSELVGLRTGFPFGLYHYTNRWWPVLDLPGIGDFPLLLPFAWMLVAGCAYLIVAGAWWSAPVAALIAVAVDQAMEPAMTRSLGYWVWVDWGPLAAGSPVQNAVAWFSVTLIAALAMQRVLSGRAGPRTAPTVVLTVHVVMAVAIAALIPARV